MHGYLEHCIGPSATVHVGTELAVDLEGQVEY